MDEMMRIADILYTNVESIKNTVAIVATIGSLLMAGWKIVIYDIPLCRSSSIEIALMSRQEQWKYSCLNIITLAISVWIMDLGIGWLSRTNEIKEIYVVIMLFSLLEVSLLFVIGIGNWGYKMIKGLHISRFGISLIKELRNKKAITGKQKSKKQTAEKESIWICEKWRETAVDKKGKVFNFYTCLLLGIIMFNITASGAITYEGMKQRILVSTVLTVITMQVIVGLISMKKQVWKASIIFFSPENHKNIYIYLKNNQGYYICGNNKTMEECTEYYVIPQEHILDKKLKLVEAP